MSIQVEVNPGQIVINDGSTFLVSAADGSIEDTQAQGLFAHDTRVLSYYAMYLNRERLKLLASSSLDHHSALYVYTNPKLDTIRDSLPQNKLSIKLRRDLIGGLHEDIDITNWHQERVEIDLALALRSDFADLFQVKSNDIVTHGQIETQWKNNELSIDYRSDDFHCGLTISCDRESSTLHNANGRLAFRVALEPRESWHVCLNYRIRINDEQMRPQATCCKPRDSEGGRLSKEFLVNATRIEATNSAVNRAYQQAVIDMSALRFKIHSDQKEYWMPAAGIPWFMTVFGRDSIIVSLQTLPIHSEFAQATLTELSSLQATEVDDWRDAQPGRMPHEYRRGELTQLGERPYSPYYGTIDATPLWIITLAESFQWNADASILERCQEPLRNALSWIDDYGDCDGDGFVEYLCRSAKGTYNQGWKDSGDAIVYPDGSKVKAPIALCEVQGEVYCAWRMAADLYDNLEQSSRAQELRKKADKLYAQFQEDFWMEEEGFYCLGLDAEKKQIRSITSNPGQLLWTGIVPPDRAEKLVKRLFAEDMWCGWGIRTMSSKHTAYNPMSYQCGSVWPVDNGLIAWGLKRYGYHQEAAQIAEGIFAAANYFKYSRLPEVFSGERHTAKDFPVPYINANCPQGWSSGAILQLIFILLGVEANASKQLLSINPVLPEWLPELKVSNLSLGNAMIDINFQRQGDRTLHEVTELKGNLKVVRSNAEG